MTEAVQADDRIMAPDAPDLLAEASQPPVKAEQIGIEMGGGVADNPNAANRPASIMIGDPTQKDESEEEKQEAAPKRGGGAGKDGIVIQQQKSAFEDPIEMKGFKKQSFFKRQVARMIELLDAKEEGKRLKRVLRDALEAVEMDKTFKLASLSGVDVICLMSNAAAIVFFLGGLTQFQSKGKEKLYCTGWAICFWTCGILCFSNLFYFRQVPFHNFPIDLLTSYVHIPAFLAWQFWRKYLRSRHALHLVQDVLLESTEYATAVLVMASRAAFIGTLVVMFAMSCVVLIGYSHRTFEVAHHELADDLRYSSFMWWHGAIMYIVIPPVISSVFCSYSMLMFFSGLHIMDVTCFTAKLEVIMSRTNEQIKDTLAKRQPFELSGMHGAMEGGDSDFVRRASLASDAGFQHQANKEKARARKQKRMNNLKKMHGISKKSTTGLGPGVTTVSNVEKNSEHSSSSATSGLGNVAIGSPEFLSHMAYAFAEAERTKNAQEIFDDAMEEVSTLAVEVQFRLTTSCNMWSTISMHLLLFSICQVLIVTGDARLHALGAMKNVPMTYYWVLMDFFHLSGGVVLIVLNMGTGAVVTSGCRSRVGHLLRLAEALDVGRSQIAAFMVLLQGRITGYAVWGQPVDAQKCIMISFAVFVLCVNNVTEILNTKINSDGRPLAGEEARMLFEW